MPGNVRLTDLWMGICCCHPEEDECINMMGNIITSSPDVRVNSLNQARFLDIAIGFCGHIGTIVTASADSECNNRGIARCGDVVMGCITGTIITCSPDVNTN